MPAFGEESPGPLGRPGNRLGRCRVRNCISNFLLHVKTWHMDMIVIQISEQWNDSIRTLGSLEMASESAPCLQSW